MESIIPYVEFTLEPGRKLIDVFAEMPDENVHIILKEGLYFSGGTETDCLYLKKKHVFLEGRGDVVIYDNRGHMINAHPYPMERSSLAHTLLIDASTVILKNITLVNGCNIDFQYKDIFLPKVSSVITQAYAFGGWNMDRLEIENSKFYSILDTFDLKNVKEVSIRDSYIQGNNDFIAVGERTGYYNCTFRNMGPCPMWSAPEGYMIFDQCTFRLDDDVEQFSFTKRGGNMAFLNSRIYGRPEMLQMEIEPQRESRYYLYHTTYNDKPAVFRGFEESFVELSEPEYAIVHNRAFNSLKLKIEGPEQIRKKAVFQLDQIPDSVCSTDNIQCRQERDRIFVSSSVTGKDQPAFLEVRAGFLRQKIYFSVVGEKVLDPCITKELSARMEDGKLTVDYCVACTGEIQDLSFVEVFQNDRLLYRMTKHEGISLLPSDIGRSFRLVLHALTEETREYVCNPLSIGPVRPEDIKRSLIVKDFSGYMLEDREHLYAAKSEFSYLGEEVPNFVRFSLKKEPPFTYTWGTDNAKGIRGLLYTGRGACLVYPIREKVRRLSLSFDLAVEKSSGEGFGSANGQYLELFTDYDPLTLSGTALRLEREASTARGVFMSVRNYGNGTNRLVGEKLFTRSYKTPCRISAEFDGRALTFCLTHQDSTDSLSVPCGHMVSAFMLRCSGTTGIGNRFLLLGMNLEYC